MSALLWCGKALVLNDVLLSPEQMVEPEGDEAKEDQRVAGDQERRRRVSAECVGSSALGGRA